MLAGVIFTFVALFHLVRIYWKKSSRTLFVRASSLARIANP
jgi:hypothetical protein